MRLTLVTSSYQTIDVDDDVGDLILNLWKNGDEDLAVEHFEDVEQLGYHHRLVQEPNQ